MYIIFYFEIIVHNIDKKYFKISYKLKNKYNYFLALMTMVGTPIYM